MGKEGNEMDTNAMRDEQQRYGRHSVGDVSKEDRVIVGNQRSKGQREQEKENGGGICRQKKAREAGEL